MHSTGVIYTRMFILRESIVYGSPLSSGRRALAGVQSRTSQVGTPRKGGRQAWPNSRRVRLIGRPGGPPHRTPLPLEQAPSRWDPPTGPLHPLEQAPSRLPMGPLHPLEQAPSLSPWDPPTGPLHPLEHRSTRLPPPSPPSRAAATTRIRRPAMGRTRRARARDPSCPRRSRTWLRS